MKAIVESQQPVYIAYQLPAQLPSFTTKQRNTTYPDRVVSGIYKTAEKARDYNHGRTMEVEYESKENAKLAPAKAALPMDAAPFVDKIVAPGDIVLDLTKLNIATVRLGGGLRQDQDFVSATKAGRLKFTKPNKFWVEGSQKRYIANVDDVVIGLVVDRRSESFTIDVGAPTYGSLSIFAFEGATRRNVPNLQAGSVLYMRVVNAHRDMTPELSCVDATGKASGFGPLKNGFVFECSTGLARLLMSRPTCPVLDALGKSLSFEIAVGLNGRVWVNAPAVSTVILVSNAIMNAEVLGPAQQQLMVQRLLQRVQ